MMLTKNTLIKPQHTAFRNALVNVYREHGKGLDAQEMLALAAQLVGQLLAIQDQRRVSVEMCMEMISANIEAGNAQAIAELQKTGGNA